MSTITYLETPYASSLGPVVAHETEPNAYRIKVAGQVRTILANGECSEANVEADIANPAQPTQSTEALWAEWLAGTVTDPVTGIELKASIAARDAFVGQISLIREALDAGVIIGTDTLSVWDASNIEHTLTIADLRALLLRYGIAWQTAFNQLAP